MKSGLFWACASILCGSFGLTVFPGTANADFKMATVDVTRVLNESKEAKEKKKDLDERTLEAKKSLDQRGNALKALEKKVKDSSASGNAKESEQLRTEVRDFQRAVKDAEEDLKKDFLKFNKDLTEKALKLMVEYAKRNNLDLVLDKSERNKGPVLFGSAALDITEEIIAEMNR